MNRSECRRNLREWEEFEERTDDCVFRTLYAFWEAIDEMGEKRRHFATVRWRLIFIWVNYNDTLGSVL